MNFAKRAARHSDRADRDQICCTLPRNDIMFYELCDEMGLYVVDEANIESHGVDFDWSKTLGNKDF